MLTPKLLIVPLVAVVTSHTQLFATIVASLNAVTVDPEVVSVVVVPAVSTDAPPADLSVPCLITHVVLALVPFTTAYISVIVAALVTLNSVTSSWPELPTDSIVTDLVSLFQSCVAPTLIVVAVMFVIVDVVDL
jgi:hypothetical protein